MEKIKAFRLSGNALKLLASLFMLADHLGMILFPSIVALRAIGRLAFPIFAYMIAEGAQKTHNRLRYFLRIFVVGAGCQLVYSFLNPNSNYVNVLLTFSFSLVAVWSFERLKDAIIMCEKRKLIAFSAIEFIVIIALAVFLTDLFLFDYGLIGILTPIFCSFFHSRDAYPEHLVRFDNKFVHVAMLIVPLSLLVIGSTAIQAFSFLSLPILLLYSGKRGKLRMKYFFYIFYPAHLAILQIIAWIISLK